MLNLPHDPNEAARSVHYALREVGVRELARRTGIPVTTVSRAILNIRGAPFERVLILLDAARTK